jgi:hypothetical protein
LERRLAAILADDVVVCLEDTIAVQDDVAYAILAGKLEPINLLLIELVDRKIRAISPPFLRTLRPIGPQLIK